MKMVALHEFQLRPDVRVTFPLPDDLTHRDVVRLSAYLAALVEPPAELVELVVEALPRPEEPELPEPELPEPELPEPELPEPVVVVTPPPPRPRPRPPRPQECVERVHALAEEFAATRPALALCTAAMQRRAVAAFAAAARAFEEGYGAATTEAAKYLVGTLSLWSKQCWPGFIRCLKLASPPSSVLHDLERRGWVHSWAEAAELAAPHRIVDPRVGWAPERQAGAAATAPAVIAAAIAAVEPLTGSLMGPPDTADALTDADLAVLARHAAALRTVRLSTTAPERWGLVWGRLRWVSQQHGQTALALFLRESVQPTVPPQEDEADEREALLASPPQSPCDVSAWLVRAWEHLSDQELAPLLPPDMDLDLVEGEVLRDAGDETRRRRRRMRNLRAIRAGVAPAEEPAPAAPEEAVESPPVLAEARALVDGKRALFVTNRRDPELEATFLRELGVAVTTIEEGRSAVGAERAVLNGTYDLVLLAESFVGHGLSLRFQRAVRKADVPLVWVHHGRLVAVARALVDRLGSRARGT